MAELPTDITVWDYKTPLPRRLASWMTADEAVMSTLVKGASTPPSRFSNPTLLARVGAGVSEVNTGADDDHSICGFKLPIEVTEAIAAELDAGRAVCMYIRRKGTHTSPGVGNQMPVAHNDHGTADAEHGNWRDRWENGSGIGVGDYVLQTVITEWNGSTSTQTTHLHASVTTEGLREFDGGYAEYLTEFAPIDPALGNVTHKHNKRTTVRSATQAITHVAHYPTLSVASAPNPRTPTAQITSGAYFCFGVSPSGSSGGFVGEQLMLAIWSRDCSNGMLTDTTEIGQIMDWIWNDLPIGGDLSTLTAAHAYTGEPGHTLEDVAIGGTLDLTSSGTGAEPTFGAAPLPGLPDRFRGIISGASSGKGAASSALTDFIEDVLADGDTLGALIAVKPTTAGWETDNAARTIFGGGGTANTAIGPVVRKTTGNAITVSINEGSGSLIALTVGDAEDLGMVAGETCIVLAQQCNEAAYHSDEDPANQQTLIVDTLSEAGITRTELYPDEDASVDSMVITTSDSSYIGVNAAGAQRSDAAVVVALFRIPAGEILSQGDALNLMEGFWVRQNGLTPILRKRSSLASRALVLGLLKEAA